MAAARADYGRLLGALYGEARYSAVISIRADGREVADIAPLDDPQGIGTLEIVIEPGPAFTFARARMKPYAPGTDLPPEYRDRQVARSSAVKAAAEAGVAGWRNVGHAKARVAGQQIVADHASATLDSQILLEAGPLVRFGRLNMSGYDRLEPRRLAKIAGFPNGEVFDPDALDVMAERLRRTEIFRSVVLREAESLGPGDTLDVDLVVEELPLRRFGFGADVSSFAGASVSGYWLHRNLLGGGERLRIDGAIDGLGGQLDFIEYSLGARIERPATPSADTTTHIQAEFSRSSLVD